MIPTIVSKLGKQFIFKDIMHLKIKKKAWFQNVCLTYLSFSSKILLNFKVFEIYIKTELEGTGRLFIFLPHFQFDSIYNSNYPNEKERKCTTVKQSHHCLKPIKPNGLC